jgi:hypothetical protein
VGGTEQKGLGRAANDRAVFEAASEGVRRLWRAKQYGEEQRPCGSATIQWSSAATEKGQAVWPGTGARRSATRSAVRSSGGGDQALLCASGWSMLVE